MDKKLKNAGDKITMPDDMKERIIRACESAEKNNITRIDNEEGYAEVVSGTERVAPRSRIIRTVSAVAACTVLLAGVGTTGVLLHRQNSNISASSNVSENEYSCPFGDFSTFKFSFDAGDGKYGNYSAETYAKLSDFFNKFDWGEELSEDSLTEEEKTDTTSKFYTISWSEDDKLYNINISELGFAFYMASEINYIEGEGEKVEFVCGRLSRIDFDAFDSGVKEILAQDTDRVSPFGDFREYDFDFQAGIGMYNRHTNGTISDRLTVLLNNFDWGEEQDDVRDTIVLNDCDYTVSWEVDHVISWLYIANDGYVMYTKNQYDDDYLESTELERKAYRIDFAAFEQAFENIISEDIYIDPIEADALMEGTCISAVLFDKDRKRIVPETDEIQRQLEYFLRDEFVPMLQVNIPDIKYDSKLERYYIDFNFVTDDNNIRYVSFSILENGVVGCNEYILKDGEREPNGVANYGIDFEKFESRLGELGSGFKFLKEDDDESVDDGSDRSIYDILKSVETEKQEYLKGYNDVEMVVEVRDAEDNEIILSDDSKEKLRTFAENEFKFESMLKSESLNGERLNENLPQVYGIDIMYMSDGKEVLGRYYNIMGDGVVVLSDCEYDTNGESTWSGPFWYFLDINELYAKLEECGVR